MNRFEGRTVLVTGGGGGIGAAVCRMFHGEGASIIVADLDGGEASRVAQGLSSPGRIHTATFDVTDSASVATGMDDAISRFGRLDVLVNCAGVHGEIIPAIDASPMDFQRTIDINLVGTFNCCQAFAKAVVKTGRQAAIVNLSSAETIWSRPSHSAYGASKHGVSGLTRQLAFDFGPHGIRVNAVAPGVVRSPLAAHDLGMEAEFCQANPIPRIGEPDDVAAVILYLASDGASFITGVNLPVDGGYSAGKTWQVTSI